MMIFLGIGDEDVIFSFNSSCGTIGLGEAIGPSGLFLGAITLSKGRRTGGFI